MAEIKSANMLRAARAAICLSLVFCLLLTTPIWAQAADASIGDKYLLPETQADADTYAHISLVGPKGSPEYNGYTAWNAWLEDWQQSHPERWDEADAYDRKHASLDNYAASYYNAIFPEQATELEQIMDKYGLEPLKARALFDMGETEAFFDALDMEPFLANSCDNASGYIYDNGSFNLEGTCQSPQCDFSIYLNVKGSFSMISGLCPATASWQQYTTEDRYTLAVSSDARRTTVMTETEGAYICIQLYGSLGKDSLKAFIDSVDFASLAERFDGTVHEQTAQSISERAKQQFTSYSEAVQDWNTLPLSYDPDRIAYTLNLLGDLRLNDLPSGYTCKSTLTKNSVGNLGYIWYESAYFDEIQFAFESDDDLDPILHYIRFYASEARSESDNERAFDALKSFSSVYPEATIMECNVDGYEGCIAYEDYFLKSSLYWIDPERDLMFGIFSNKRFNETVQNQMVDLASEWMEFINK